MVKNHIHYDLDAPVVRFGYQLAIFFVRTESGIYFVIIRSGIAVIRTTFHVVFQNRSEPESRNTQILEIIQILLNTCQVTSMTGIRIIAVYLIRRHTVDVVIFRIAICKTIRHEQIKGVGNIETFVFTTFLITGFQFIFFHQFLLADGKGKRKFAGFHIFIQMKINEQIIIAFQLHCTTE